MAKKKRRNRKSNSAKNSLARSNSVQNGDGSKAGEPSSRNETREGEVNAGDQRSSEEALREEYSYVLRDLRRVAILAAAMFVLLILINILLQ